MAWGRKKKKLGKNVEAKCWNIFKNVNQHYDENVDEFFLKCWIQQFLSTQMLV
jgi:hypothetical protein